MALAEMISQAQTVVVPPEPTPQQAQVMQDTRSGEMTKVYENAGQTPPGGSHGNILAPLLGTGHWVQGLVVVGFLVVLIMLGMSLRRIDKRRGEE